ncbi:MAG: hypothetical protein KGO49_12905 [Gammaproteobacteria bacterium]|nr:hypothetical protein [Gammaproteobacteria bacterium]
MVRVGFIGCFLVCFSFVNMAFADQLIEVSSLETAKIQFDRSPALSPSDTCEHLSIEKKQMGYTLDWRAGCYSESEQPKNMQKKRKLKPAEFDSVWKLIEQHKLRSTHISELPIPDSGSSGLKIVWKVRGKLEETNSIQCVSEACHQKIGDVITKLKELAKH